MKKLARLFFLINSLFFTAVFAQEFNLYRINDLVGDTIDITEREQYYLFPGISNFQLAIFFKTDRFYLSQINYLHKDTLKTDTLLLTASDLKRINHYFNNIDKIKELINRDAAAKAAYDRFWQEIESKQIYSTATQIKYPKTKEGRVFGSITGMTLGSVIGGVVGSQLGIEYIGTRYERCFPALIRIPMYQVNQPVFCGINTLTIGAGTCIGYKLGEQKDIKYSPIIGIKEGKSWQIGCGITSGIIGTTIGALLAGLSVATLFGKTDNITTREVEGEEAIFVPALLMGIGVAYNITYWGYQLGKSIDHNNAVKRAKKNIKPTHD